jgi:hypothetical protein
MVLIPKNNEANRNKQIGNNVNVNNSMVHINTGKSVNLQGAPYIAAKNMNLNYSYDGKLL